MTARGVLVVFGLILSFTGLLSGRDVYATPSSDEGLSVSDVTLDTTPHLSIPLERSLEKRREFMERFRSSDPRNLRPLYEEYIDVIGANGLIRSLHEQFPRCHNQGHDLGKVIFAKLGNVNDALRTCGNACFSGCMHGVVMEVFADVTEQGRKRKLRDFGASDHVAIYNLRHKIGRICSKEAMISAYRYGDCLHGVGHALMYLSNYDIDLTMKYCGLFDTHVQDYYCATGAYMEYANIKVLNSRNETDGDGRSPFYPCDEKAYPAACFRYALRYLMKPFYRDGNKFIDLVNACMSMDHSHRLGCFHGIGNSHVILIGLGEATLGEICQFGKRDDQYVCIEGVMERVGKYRPEYVEPICESVDGWRKTLCLESGERKLYDMGKPFELYMKD